MTAVAIIPARYASSRLPGKPLLRDTGKYLIQHVYEQVSHAARLRQVIVATDDERIVRAVKSFDGHARMTRSDHPSGTDRIAEIAAALGDEIIVNVQGDEPEIRPADIDRLVELLADQADCDIATLACPFGPDADPSDPNAVKVVVDRRGRALYFSRGLIPYPRDTAGRPKEPGDCLLHLGIYAYRRTALMRLADTAPTPLEQQEKLEQLRALESGMDIAVAVVGQAAPGIDTREDYAGFVERCRAGG